MTSAPSGPACALLTPWPSSSPSSSTLSPALQWLPRALLELPRLSSLHLSDVGLGRAPPPPRMHPTLATGIYPLPPGLAALAGRLREVVLLEHTCAPDELAVLSTVSGTGRQ